MPTWPVPSASSVGGDIQLRTTFAVPSVKIQPKPNPLAQPITAITASGIGWTAIAAPRERRGTRSAIVRPWRSMTTQISAPGIAIRIVPCSPSAQRMAAPTSGPLATPRVPPVT